MSLTFWVENCLWLLKIDAYSADLTGLCLAGFFTTYAVLLCWCPFLRFFQFPPFVLGSVSAA